MTVERLENEMSADELNDWMEFYQLEPFGDEEIMSDKRHGILCSVVANSGFVKYDPKLISDDFELYSNKKDPKPLGINLEDMDEEQIKEAQSAIIQIMTAV